MNKIENKVELYILAGVATSENFLDDLKHALERRYELVGTAVKSSILYPYGDWNKSLFNQVIKVSYDSLRKRKFRAQHIANQIKASHRGGRIVIVGHSIGGVVAVHIANKLEQILYPDVQVVQIGSPKCAIPQKNRASTLYIRSLNQEGKASDPITRLGSWGGWEGKGVGTSWNNQLHAPDHIISIPLIGGHADYFRISLPFINQNGNSNLELVSDRIWAFIHGEQ